MEDQLIAAATGLSNMVIKSVKACEAAQIAASKPATVRKTATKPPGRR